MQRFIYALRCWLCEVFICWALDISPDGYVPSCVEAVIKVEKKNKKPGNLSAPGQSSWEVRRE